MTLKPVQKIVVPVRYLPAGYPDYVLLFPEQFMPDTAEVFMDGQLCAPAAFKSIPDEGMSGDLHLLSNDPVTTAALNTPETAWMAFITPEQHES